MGNNKTEKRISKLEDKIESQRTAKARLEAELQAMIEGGIESRIAAKKKQKKDALLDSAYDLFTTEGLSNTTIRDIAHRAGVAKGTFYLYFADKEAVLDELTRRRAASLLKDACSYMDESMGSRRKNASVADKFIFIVDYLIDRVVNDKDLLKLVSKDLTRGLFRLSPGSSIEGSDPEDAFNADAADSEALDFAAYIRNMLDADGVKVRDLKLLIFTLLNLVNSTCYDILIYKEPVSLEEYKPYLNNCIRLLVSDAVI